MSEELQPIQEKNISPLEGGFELTQDQEIQDPNFKPNVTPVADNTVLESSPQQEASEIESDQTHSENLDKESFGGVLDTKSKRNFSIDIRKVNRQ